MFFNSCSDGADDAMDDDNNNQNGDGILVDLNAASFSDLKTYSVIKKEGTFNDKLKSYSKE